MGRSARAKRSQPGNGGALDLRRVLVVEDDAILAMAAEEILREGGVEQVDLCTTTESALAVLREAMPEAIILDVHLADRDDGWAIAELVQALGENRPKIIFATGSPQDIPAQIAELGLVLEKPYTPEALVAALRGPERKGLLARLRGDA